MSIGKVKEYWRDYYKQQHEKHKEARNQRRREFAKRKKEEETARLMFFRGNNSPSGFRCEICGQSVPYNRRITIFEERIIDLEMVLFVAHKKCESKQNKKFGGI